jgi:hypothetical protein
MNLNDPKLDGRLVSMLTSAGFITMGLDQGPFVKAIEH